MAAPQKGEEPHWGEIPQFRTLRRLVTVLTATLIVGVLSIVIVLVIRIAMEPSATRATKIGADEVTIPAGAEITAVGATAGSLTIAIREDGVESLLIFDPQTGGLVKRVAIARD